VPSLRTLDVGRLQVAVDDALLVRGFRAHSAICLAMGKASSIGIAPRAIRLGEILTLDEFPSRGRGWPVDFLDRVDRGDVADD